MARARAGALPSPAGKLLGVLSAVARRPNTPLATLAAELEPQHLAAFLALGRRCSFTRYTLTDAKRLEREIARTRKQGFAVTNQEFLLHIVGAAVPVRDGRGRMIAALSLAAPTVRLGLARLTRLVPRLKAAADRLARHLSPAEASRSPAARGPGKGAAGPAKGAAGPG